MTGWLKGAVLYFVVTASTALALDLTAEQFPSEEEIYEALLAGEITYEQYLILQELIFNGLDSTNVFLADEIPNLSFFERPSLGRDNDLESEQRLRFLGSEVRSTDALLTGKFRYRFSESDDISEAGQYHLNGEIKLYHRFGLNFKARRDRNGQERIVGRTLSYEDQEGIIREIKLGSFYQRWGEGTAIGYRGCLLECEKHLNKESFLYPDFGGFNGALISAQAGGSRLKFLASQQRDSVFRLLTSGVMADFSNKSRLQPYLILSLNRLSHRDENTDVTDYKAATGIRYRYGHGYNRMEVARQDGFRSSWAAFITAGRHQYESSEVNYAFWSYNRNYLDLSGGGKAAGIRHHSEIAEMGFEYSDKRPGQTGGLIKTRISLYDQWNLSNSLLYAFRDEDTTRVQWLSSLIRKLNRQIEVGANFLLKRDRHGALSQESEIVRQEGRLEAKLNTERLYLRHQIGYTDASNSTDGYLWFIDLRFRYDDKAQVELWSSMKQIDLSPLRVDYWYCFVSNEAVMLEWLSVAAKLSHSFSKGSSIENRTRFTLEVTATI